MLGSRYFLVLFLAVWAGSGRSQPRFYHFGEGDGLASGMVTSLLMDRSGFIWVASSAGICRFDGNDFLYFDHPGDNFPDLSQSDEFELFEDRNGIIWIGTRDQGLYSYDPLLKRSVHYSHREGEPGTLSDNFVNFIFEDRQGNLWVGVHSHGLDLFDNTAGRFTNFRPSSGFPGLVPRLADDLICHEPDPQDGHLIWFGSLAGIFSFDTRDAGWEYYPVEKAGAADPASYTENARVIRSIAFDRDGLIWAGTWGGGLLHYNITSEKYRVLKYEGTEPVNGFRNNIKQLDWKDTATLWIVAPYRGLGVFDTRSGMFDFYDVEGMGANAVLNPVRLLEDDHGFVWLASRSNGIYYFNRYALQFRKTRLPYTLSLVRPGRSPGTVLAAAAGAVSRIIEIDPATGEYTAFGYRPLYDAQENLFAAIIPDSGRTWIVESFNLYAFSNGSMRPYDDFNPGTVSQLKQSQPFFISGVQHASGDLWLGSKFHGLFRVNPGSGRYLNYYAADSGLNISGFGEFIYCLYADPAGKVWYGSENFGFYEYSRDRFVEFVSDRDVGGSDVQIRYVQSIVATPDGNMWFGTEKNGIAVLSLDGDSLSFVTSFSRRNGMASNDVRALEVDIDGSVWAITGEGLSRINPAYGTVENYGSQHGLSAILGMSALPDGTMIAGSDYGYYLFDPRGVVPFKIPPVPYIRSFSVFDVPVNYRRLADSIGRVDLKHDQNFFAIEFGLIDYLNSPDSKLFYMMDGLDNDWQEAPNNEHISYANLAGGSYVFRLRAAGGESLELPILIGTPFWKTYWFYMLLALLVVSGMVGLYLVRMRQVRKQESIRSEYNRMINELEMKALRAQMNPHFLFNSLNSIRYYILKEEYEHASDYITRFSKLLRFILRNSRQSMISLKDELETLKIYIEFEQMRFGKSFSYSCRIDPSVNPESIMVQPMTLQPFVENAIWHGLMPKERDRRLTVDIVRVDHQLRITVEDNGVGRKAGAAAREMQEEGMTETKSFGLRITGERFALHSKVSGKRSDFMITDLAGVDGLPAGTRVTINYEL